MMTKEIVLKKTAERFYIKNLFKKHMRWHIMNKNILQIGFFVNNEYSEPFDPENIPNPVEVTKLTRNILVDQQHAEKQ